MSLLAVAELVSDPSRNSILYKIYPVDAEDAWVRVEHQLIEPNYRFFMTSSNGHTMEVKVKMEANAEPNKRSRSIKPTWVQEKTGWVQIPLPDKKNVKDAVSRENSLWMRQEREFASPQLRNLQAIARDFDELKDQAINSVAKAIKNIRTIVFRSKVP